MNIRYRVDLDQSERDELTAMLRSGKHPARRFKRAQILLAADAGHSDKAIAATVVVGGSTVYLTKRRPPALIQGVPAFAGMTDRGSASGKRRQLVRCAR